jgi:hypothetical protein
MTTVDLRAGAGTDAHRPKADRDVVRRIDRGPRALHHQHRARL